MIVVVKDVGGGGKGESGDGGKVVMVAIVVTGCGDGKKSCFVVNILSFPKIFISSAYLQTNLRTNGWSLNITYKLLLPGPPPLLRLLILLDFLEGVRGEVWEAEGLLVIDDDGLPGFSAWGSKAASVAAVPVAVAASAASALGDPLQTV